MRGYDVEASSPVLGTYLGLYVPGNIKLGDPVYVDSPGKWENMEIWIRMPSSIPKCILTACVISGNSAQIRIPSQ